MNVFEFAIKMELQGKDYYEKLAQEASHPGLRTIFSSLARDEQKHYETFKALKEGGTVVAMAESTALDSARNVFEELVADANRGRSIKGDLESYQFAMKIEAESFRLYEGAAAHEKDPQTRALLQRVASEEHNHFTILENVYHFVNAPNNFLAWGEFSNLGEFRNFGRSVDE